jgi:NCS1 family nucleobase:cation symporter-1
MAAEEFEREPVPERAQLGFNSFLGMYAGEHTAGTEFMIGPLFVAWGASAFDLVVGLFLGNLLAVLTWRFLTAEIAVAERLTLYYKLEKICGRPLVVLYNFFNGLLFCFLAGAMVTVSATAVGVPFGDAVKMPTLQDKWPTSAAFVVICLVLGIVMTLVAIRGYAFVARVGHVAAPWMFLVFVACGLVMMSRLGSVNLFKLIQPDESAKDRIPFWGYVAFAWFCNSAMHLGMADLSVLRFARKPSCGWASASGMFLGHYVAWICAALLLVYWVDQRDADKKLGVPPGVMAYDAVGWAGIACVVIAGWTTANPTIYRAGLAFQSMFPKTLSRNAGTALAGVVCTIAGAFPLFAMRLLDFVGLYGTVLAPMGAIVFVDHFLARRMGFAVEPMAETPSSINLNALLAYALSVGAAIVTLYEIPHLEVFHVPGMKAYYLPLPAWIACGVLYVVFSKLFPKPAASAATASANR